MKSIILTGPKHSGKTSAGKALAHLLSCDFIDLDEFILQRSGKAPRQLYSEGPVKFRKAEADALASAAGFNAAESGSFEWGSGRSNQRVIATGGGIVDNVEAAAILKMLDAAVAYLNISADSAWDRIANSPDGELPPFLETENPRETHRALHERRCAAYLQLAKIVIEAEGKSPEEIAAEIAHHAAFTRPL